MFGREIRMLLRHYLEHGTSKSALARKLGVHRDTIHRWIREGELDRDLDDEPVRYGPRRPVPTKLDAYIRIGSHSAVVRFAEHVVIPAEAERACGPFAFFKPVPNQLSALYVVGVEASAAYCGKAPKVRITQKGLDVKAWAWTPGPGRGCEPAGARIIKKSCS
jgi:hypothetical protein